MRKALVLGGNGFIGHHMARRLTDEGYWVRVVDIKPYEYGIPRGFFNENVIGDLRSINVVRAALRYQRSGHSMLPQPFEKEEQFDEVYMYACCMGGAGFVFTKQNDAEIMHDSALMNLNLVNALLEQGFKGKVFYSSSACVYPEYLQMETTISGLKEVDAYPAQPDSCYGFEKLFSEKLYDAYARNHGLNVRIARFHNIYGPEGTYTGGKEKAPAAMCRKAIECAKQIEENNFDGSLLNIWGDGEQTRSFLYIDDCIDAVRLLMESDFKEPINIGSEEMVTINHMADLAIELTGKPITKNHIEGPTGVRGRNSNNDLIRKVLGWEPKWSLQQGIEQTYRWILSQYK